MNFAIIGAGQIGSRHLQSLIKGKSAESIYVIDPLMSSLKQAEIRVSEIGKAKGIKVHYSQTLDPIPSHIDLAIVATTANARAEVISRLLKNRSIKYLILEKFLFQNPADFKKVAEILNSKKIKTWVNCGRRTWPVYQKIKKDFGKDSEVSVLVTGSNWGLLSNAIHFIDLCSYLAGNEKYNLTGNIDSIFNSKRKGFIEASGYMSGEFSGQLFFSIVSFKDGESPIIVEIKTPKKTFVVNETKKTLTVIDTKNNKLKKSSGIDIPLVSQQHNIIRDIISTGDCALPTYKTSSALHLPLLSAVSGLINKYLNKKYTNCPIT